MTPAGRRQFGNLKKPVPPIVYVAHRQVAASIVDVRCYNNISYPATNCKTKDGVIAYGAATPYVNTSDPNQAIILYADLGAPKKIQSVDMQGVYLIDYGTLNAQYVTAGFWVSNDSVNWQLGYTATLGGGDSGPLGMGGAAWRYVGYGVYSYYVYDGYIAIDCLEIVAEA